MPRTIERSDTHELLPIKMLTDLQRELWKAYEAAEGCAPRAEKLLALEAFLDALTVSSSCEWFPWARTIAEQVVDCEVRLVIRRPLFERAVFPALLAGYRSCLPGCARWVAGLAQNVWNCPECRAQLPPNEQTELGLIRAALRHDPSDFRSRLRLIETIAARLRYSLHELPSGVLYGMNGATPEQCRELGEELEEFRQLVAGEDIKEGSEELIRSCRRHFEGYRNYLSSREQYGTYAEYLFRHPG